MQTWAQPFAAPNGQWQLMVVNWDTVTAQLQDLSPGIGYDVQIRGVDKTGNVGAWSSVTTFVDEHRQHPAVHACRAERWRAAGSRCR
jgi:chitodextrinase